jgi:hypothetical protein
VIINTNKIPKAKATVFSPNQHTMQGIQSRETTCCTVRSHATGGTLRIQPASVLAPQIRLIGLYNLIIFCRTDCGRGTQLRPIPGHHVQPSYFLISISLN